ncbi:MAG: ATP-binding protein, partial [Caulobacteraceae bacterium]
TPPGPRREDAWLMVEQAQRCRDILRRLAQAPEAGDILHERMSLIEVAREASAGCADGPAARVACALDGPPGMAAPQVWRRPAILHALTAFVENACDFAHAEIAVTARFDATTIAIEVRDDGPGFSADVMEKLGDPYLASRPRAQGPRAGHVGMGLGFFIDKTLIEHTGGKVAFRNAPGGGAVVTARWPRERVEAPHLAPRA